MEHKEISKTAVLAFMDAVREIEDDLFLVGELLIRVDDSEGLLPIVGSRLHDGIYRMEIARAVFLGANISRCGDELLIESLRTLWKKRFSL